MNQKAEKLIQCFVNISSKREREDLERSIVQTLVQLLSTHVQLIRVRNSNDDFNPSYEWQGILDDDNQVVVKALNIEITPAEKENITYYVKQLDGFEQSILINYNLTGEKYWPLIVNGKVNSLLVLPDSSYTSSHQETLQAIATIYNNFLALLEAGEKDALTGLYNRRVFDTQLLNLIQRIDIHHKIEQDRRADKLTQYDFLGIIDIDFFKRVNDQYGHLFGDEVLLWLSQMMRSCFRNQDSLFRYGGEEFAVLLRNIASEQAQSTFERFLKKVASTSFPQLGKITVSIGYTKITENTTPTMTFGEADQALYYSKQHGRNQVNNYQKLIEIEAINLPDESKNDFEIF